VIFAVDTNVLLDILLADPVHGASSKKTLEIALSQGHLILCPIVYAELAPLFPNSETQDQVMNKMGVRFKPFTREALHLSGFWWKKYLMDGGKRRNRILADFLIAAFAKERAHALITRDAFFSRYVEVFYYN
jgi:predicted nucleic acid-binding protein